MRNALDNRKLLKKKKCKVCKKLYQPFSSLSKTCSTSCAIRHVEAIREAQEARRRKDNRKDIRRRREALKTLSDWIREAQTAFNAYIRYRDRDDPCISCKEYVDDSDLICGSRWDCGHYLTRGGFPELRFSELNAHKQCSSCNGGSAKFAKKNQTVSKNYRINLLNKIGQKNLDWLEGAHKAQHWSIDDIKDIKAYYKEQLKYLEQHV